MLIIAVFLTVSSTAISETYIIAKNQKVKKQKKEKNKKGPNAQAYEHANPNARFKRDENYKPQEEKLDKKKQNKIIEEEEDKLHKKTKGKKKSKKVK